LQRLLKERYPDLPVVVMTGQADVPSAVAAMKAGAVDFLEKPFEPETLLTAIETALQERTRRPGAGERARAITQRLATLTPRETEVLPFIVRGLSNKLIARELGTSPRTIEVHRGRIMEKLNVSGLVNLVEMMRCMDEVVAADGLNG
jgi:two-component system response regulator FixJ